MGLNRRTFTAGAIHFGFTVEQLTFLTTHTSDAPVNADYLVKTAHADLSAERVVTDTATIAWDWSTGGQAKAQTVAAGVLAQLLTVDGTTSGLDADLLDGQHGSFYAPVSTGVVGPASATDTAVALYNGTTGKLIKNSLILVDGSGNITGVADLTAGTIHALTGSFGNNSGTAGSVRIYGSSGFYAEIIAPSPVSNKTVRIPDVVSAAWLMMTEGAQTVNGVNTFTAANAYGTPASIVLTNATGLPTTGVLDDAVTNDKLRNSAALSVIGRSANSIGDPADIAASTDQVLRESGGALGFGTVAAGGIASNAVTFAKMQAVSASILLGNDASGTAVEEISVGNGVEFNGAAIRRSALTGDVTASAGSNATSIASNAVVTAKIADANVTLAKMADLAQDQFIGRTTASTGVPQTATITAAARTVTDDTTVAAMVTTLGGAAATGTAGTGLVYATSPALVTPTLGVAACTSMDFGNGVVADVFYGTWTPTISSATNVDSSTPRAGHYIRVGDRVFFAVRIDIDTTTNAANTQWNFSLPVATNFASSLQLAGGGFSLTVGNRAIFAIADATNDTGQCQYNAIGTGVEAFNVIGGYAII